MNQIFLTDEQCALFILFQKHYPNIGVLISQGIFDMKQGAVTLHFNQSGDINSIEKRTVTHLPKTIRIIGTD